jgi:hypothetical protein
MNKMLVVAAVAAVAFLGTASKASAASFGPCPSSTGSGTDPTYTANGGLCNVVITFNSNGSITTQISNAAPYDGVEDTLVGVINNTGAAISSFVLTGSGPTPQLFGFDSDGACVSPFTYVSAAACGSLHSPTTSGADYAGPGVSFTGFNAGLTSGTVNFAPAIAANGGTAWFSLEEPPSLNLTVTPSVPEPGSLILLGTGILALARRLRKA